MKKYLFWKIFAILFLVFLALWGMKCMKIFVLPSDWSWLKEWAAVISAGAALLAILSAIFIHLQTRRMMEPTERPIFSIVNIPAATMPDYEKGELLYSISIHLKNIGKHPAENVRLTSIFGLKDALEYTRRNDDLSLACRLDPDVGYTHGLQSIARLTEDEKEKKEYIKAAQYNYVNISYTDGYTHKKYYNEFWFKYLAGSEGANIASIEEKNIFKPYVEKLYPEISKRK